MSRPARPGAQPYDCFIIARMWLRQILMVLLILSLNAPPIHAQQQPVPQPFPKPTGTTRPTPAPTPAQTQPAPRQGTPDAPPTAVSDQSPSEAALGVAIFPNAQYIASYDAGRGQRYYLFGTNQTFTVLVNYYRALLKQKGELVFETPATHMFEIGRFREETMAFPPGVTIKDYTWGGSEGYPNPKRGAQPARYRTIIQVVPVASGRP